MILEKKDQQHALILLYFEQLPSINYRFFFFLYSQIYCSFTPDIRHQFEHIYEKEKMDAQISLVYASIERSSNIYIYFSSGIARVRMSKEHVGDNICSIGILKKIDRHYIHKDT